VATGDVRIVEAESRLAAAAENELALAEGNGAARVRTTHHVQFQRAGPLPATVGRHGPAEAEDGAVPELGGGEGHGPGQPGRARPQPAHRPAEDRLQLGDDGTDRLVVPGGDLDLESAVGTQQRPAALHGRGRRDGPREIGHPEILSAG
jgi:hypothetical protein